jgi:hypothetical protein
MEEKLKQRPSAQSSLVWSHLSERLSLWQNNCKPILQLFGLRSIWNISKKNGIQKGSCANDIYQLHWADEFGE